MISKRIENVFALDYEKRLLIFDQYGFNSSFDYIMLLKDNEFSVHSYVNVEESRVLYEEQLKTEAGKIAIVVTSAIYVPYDIRKAFRNVDLSLSELFPKLNAGVLRKYIRDLDLISYAYDSCYEDNATPVQTENFLKDTVFSAQIIRKYCQCKTEDLIEDSLVADTSASWSRIAKEVAVVRYYAARYDIAIDFTPVDNEFFQHIDDKYSSLSSQVNRNYPAIVTKTLSSICGNNKKVALIIMDGMSLFDFEVVSRHFDKIEYDYYCSYALIPTMTSISRQSLLSGKYPRELEKPFSLSNEVKEFIASIHRQGYNENTIQYVRGFQPDISHLTRFVAVIINEVDNIVHGQRQGRTGMYNDIHELGKRGKLQKLIRLLYSQGFTVFITSDHGNTPCTGVGNFRSGVEVKTRSTRAIVLKDFAQSNDLFEQNTFKYQGYYLDQNYQYYICKQGVSFDAKGESVMAHGGSSLDEVIVPFIEIKEVY